MLLHLKTSIFQLIFVDFFFAFSTLEQQPRTELARRVAILEEGSRGVWSVGASLLAACRGVVDDGTIDSVVTREVSLRLAGDGGRCAYVKIKSLGGGNYVKI